MILKCCNERRQACEGLKNQDFLPSKKNAYEVYTGRAPKQLERARVNAMPIGIMPSVINFMCTATCTQIINVDLFLKAFVDAICSDILKFEV